MRKSATGAAAGKTADGQPQSVLTLVDKNGMLPSEGL
jgi:hypothetical protein